MIQRISFAKFLKISLSLSCVVLLVCASFRIGKMNFVSSHFLDNLTCYTTKVNDKDRFVKEIDIFDKNSVYRGRLLQAQNFCFKRSPGHVQRIMVNRQKSTSMCIIPKAGCTFWINIFRFINNETEGVVYRHPDDIPRWVTHYGNKTLEYALNGNGNNSRTYLQVTSFLGDAFRFMFVRDPFQRLWSAWVDKFILPDFWFTEGISVAKLLDLDYMSTVCPINITFHEFLLYITDDYFAKHPHLINSHWAPYNLLCDPCIFRPHFIGKMETFERDTHFVLSTMNVSILEPRYHHQHHHHHNHHHPTSTTTTTTTNEQYGARGRDGEPGRQHHYKMHSSSPDRAMHEMQMLIDYTFNGLWKSGRIPMLFRECGVDKLFTAQRLWQAFQVNGYIPAQRPLPLTQWTSGQPLMASVRQAYSSWSSDPATRGRQQRRQREAAMMEGYRQIPLSLLRKVQWMYSADAVQFGYKIEPLEIFSHKT